MKPWVRQRKPRIDRMCPLGRMRLGGGAGARARATRSATCCAGSLGAVVTALGVEAMKFPKDTPGRARDSGNPEAQEGGVPGDHPQVGVEHRDGPGRADPARRPASPGNAARAGEGHLPAGWLVSWCPFIGAPQTHDFRSILDPARRGRWGWDKIEYIFTKVPTSLFANLLLNPGSPSRTPKGKAPEPPPRPKQWRPDPGGERCSTATRHAPRRLRARPTPAGRARLPTLRKTRRPPEAAFVARRPTFCCPDGCRPGRPPEDPEVPSCATRPSPARPSNKSNGDIQP